MLKILIVDDSETHLKMEKKRIQILGYETLTAVNGEETLRIVSEEKPDLMFSDTELEREFGYDVYRKAREIHPEMKAIGVSGKFKKDQEGRVIGDAEGGRYVREWNEVGVSQLLAKPYDLNRLRETLEETLGGNENDR